jgi:hypothetical protein
LVQNQYTFGQEELCSTLHYGISLPEELDVTGVEIVLPEM